jgi:putative transposase
VIDGCTRQVIGWALADHMREDLVIDALAMAVARRRPPAGVIFHGEPKQYTSRAMARYATQQHIRLSVGATGVCWDNALAGSFFGHLKTELIYRHVWPTRAGLRTAVVTSIEGFYNQRRRHSALGMISPNAFHHLLQQPAAA